MGLDTLRSEYPWPAAIPDVPEKLGGWFCGDNREILARYLTHDTRLVVELGTWQGMSAKFIIEHAPAATLICVDHWRGSPEHQVSPEWAAELPTLYDTFLRNLWPHRERVIPLRATTLEGMEKIATAGLRPDLIYIDAAHEAEAVLADVSTALRLFPRAILVGDDWKWNSVMAGVAWAFRHIAPRTVESLGYCWHSVPN